MKAMVISDIHGGISDLNLAIERFKLEKADRLLILGDFAGYFNSSSDFEVAEVLNEFSDKICAVRGNCDNERLESLFNFGVMDIRSINLNSIVITLTHGHLYNKYHLPDYYGDILIDVNGDKGPNQWGRDAFAFKVTKQGLINSYNAGIYGCKNPGEAVSEEAAGYDCAARIIKAGWKMDY